MPKITARAAVVTAVLALTLTGCAGAPESAPSEPEPVTTAEQAPEQSAAPATVEPTEADNATPSEAELRAEFVDAAERWSLGISDDEILAAVDYACQELAAGNADVVALEGAPEAVNSQFVSTAHEWFCPEV